MNCGKVILYYFRGMNDFIAENWDDISSLIGYVGTAFAASGALIALLIKWVLDGINKKREFERLLKKEFFLKKLDAASKIIGNIQLTIGTAENIKIATEAIKRDGLTNYGSSREMVSRLSKADNSNSNTNEESLHYLFFDLENEELWQDQREGIRFIENLRKYKDELAKMDSSYMEYNKLLRSNKKDEAQQLLTSIEEKIFPSYIKSVEGISEISEKILASMKEKRRILRTEFKKYDI